jgi:hypothetical protein
LRIELVDTRLDRRVGRDTDVPGLVEVGRLVDDRLARGVDDQPHSCEANALAAVLGYQHTVGPGRHHLEVGVVADDGVDVVDVVGQIEQRTGRVGQRAGRRAQVPERHDGGDAFRPQLGRLRVHRRE